MQDSTIRSILSGEQEEEENVVAQVALPPDASQTAHSDSTITLGQSPVEDADHKDRRICRALELRTELKALKDQLAAVKESEDLETQIDNLEDEYLELYTGLLPEKGVEYGTTYGYGTSLSIERTRIAEASTLSMLTGCLHPDARRIQNLYILFPLFDTKDGMRMRPRKTVTDLLDRYGLKYKPYSEPGGIIVPLPS
ncbi:hypothetical protein BDN72DRAFT_250867 [Pluteus cervinus]|uniref:Uncharacterized protein n=1 Tax=Pluteus cervinus TaxID=181527 RepID=A0ACD3AHD0_9AGAR|nr:hypothetical protein BDN72DRAFT_250867 [Pluteus cervinus]